MNRYLPHVPEPVVPNVPENIPRPPNPFMLYRSDALKDMKIKREAEGVTKGPTMAEASVIIKDMWKAETLEVVKKYRILADNAKKEHERKYPGYKYTPARRGSRKVKKERRADVEQRVNNADTTAGFTPPNRVQRGGKGFMDVFLDQYSSGSSSHWTESSSSPTPSVYANYSHSSPTPHHPKEDMPIYMSTKTDMQPELVPNEPQPEIAPSYDFNPQWDEDLVKQRIVKIYGNVDQFIPIVPFIPSVLGQISDFAAPIYPANWNDHSIDLRLLGYSESEIMAYGTAGFLSHPMHGPLTSGQVMSEDLTMNKVDCRMPAVTCSTRGGSTQYH